MFLSLLWSSKFYKRGRSLEKHVKWYPNCPYVNLIKDRLFIYSVTGVKDDVVKKPIYTKSSA